MFKSLVACLLSAILLVSFSMFAGGWSDEIIYDDTMSAVDQSGFDSSQSIMMEPLSWEDGVGVFRMSTEDGSEESIVNVRMDYDPLFFGEVSTDYGQQLDPEANAKYGPYVSGAITYTSCIEVYAPWASRPYWSQATCGLPRIVAGHGCEWSKNTEQDPQVRTRPDVVMCRYNEKGSTARAYALCCLTTN